MTSTEITPATVLAVRSRGVRYFTERGARKRAAELAAVPGVHAIVVFRTSRRRFEWECAWLAEPGAADGWDAT